MFTGLIETTGTVLCVTPEAGVTRITVGAPVSLVSRLSTGDSVAVSGVCLTALDIEPNAFPPRFSADLAADSNSPVAPNGVHPGEWIQFKFVFAGGWTYGNAIFRKGVTPVVAA